MRLRKKRRKRTYQGAVAQSRTATPYQNLPLVQREQKPVIVFEDLIAPPKFTLHYENCTEVIRYVNKIKELGKYRRNMNILMEDIKEIGEGAIAMLLSALDELDNKVLIKGTKPKQKAERDILERSGFFKYLRGQVDAGNKKTKNTILRTGKAGNSIVNIAEEIKQANETVWAERGRNPPLRGTVFEMMRNSCDHAFTDENKIIWHFAITHEEPNNIVKFSFVDNGKGIIESFTSGSLKAVLNVFRDSADILDTAFKDGIESRTGLSWRGKGLPTIFENYKDGYFNNLVVISNDVYIDFDENIHKRLDVTFSGTYYFWMLNKKCVKACYN